MPDEVFDVAIAGGGPAGLAAAWRLRARKIVVLEAAAHSGGNARGERVDGYLIERGPHTFMGSAEHMFALAEEVGIANELAEAAPEAKARYIYRDGAFHALPASPVSAMTTPLLSLRGKLRVAAEPFIPGRSKPDETVADFFARRLGAEAAEYLAGTFISGIYAGDPTRLGIRAAFPLFHQFEREGGSLIRGAMKYMRAKKKSGVATRKGLWGFAAGLGRPFEAIADTLPDGAVRTGAAVKVVRRENDLFVLEGDGFSVRARAAIVAAPPPQASAMIRALDAEAANLLAEIPLPPVAVVHLGGKKTPQTIEGFGGLVPRRYGIRTLGVVFASCLYPGRAPEGRFLHTQYLGGALDTGILDLTDDDLIALAKADHEKLLGRADIDFARVVRHPVAIPQLAPDHPERIAELQRLASAHPGLAFAGNYISGVAVNHAVGSGFDAAARLEHFFASAATRA
ncbi:protoporphyrinogen oxidase [bacterium]|nr:protoporphyrinogen oxidase [bacterium]